MMRTSAQNEIDPRPADRCSLTAADLRQSGVSPPLAQALVAIMSREPFVRGSDGALLRPMDANGIRNGAVRAL